MQNHLICDEFSICLNIGLELVLILSSAILNGKEEIQENEQGHYYKN